MHNRSDYHANYLFRRLLIKRTLRAQTATYAQTSTPSNSAPSLEWNVTFGLSYYNKACEIIQTQDGGYAVTGTCGPMGGTPNVALVKLDAGGNLLWNQTYDLTFTNYPLTTALVQTDDGGFTIVGNHNKDMVLIKTDSEGISSVEANLFGV